MIKISYLFICLLSIACTHQKKLAQQEIRLPFSSELLKDVQSVGRMPSSIIEIDNSVYSRRIYFSVLYHQFNILETHFDESNEIRFCPQFHTEKIKVDSQPKFNFIVQKQQDDFSHEAFFPEKIFQSNYSFNDYHKSIYSELVVLCEECVSENFYKFDNLMNYHVNRIDFHRGGSKAMEALLKIPIFANFYLLQMIQSQTMPYPYNQDEKNLIKLTQTHWFEQYVLEAREVRKNLINNRTVQR